MKICNHCKIKKEYQNFHKHKKSPDGYRSICKDCRKEKSKLYYKKNKFCIQDRANQYYKDNKEDILKKNKNYRINNQDKIKKRNKRWIENNKIKKRDMDKKYREKNKDKIKYNKKQYYDNNKDKINTYLRKYRKKRRNDINYKIMENLRARFQIFIKNEKISKKDSILKTIGISKKLFNKWIEFNIKIDNIKDFHLDHTIPLSYYKCKNFEDIIKSKCNHWTNIRPMVPKDNLKKSNKLPNKKYLFATDLRICIFKIKNNLN